MSDIIQQALAAADKVKQATAATSQQVLQQTGQAPLTRSTPATGSITATPTANAPMAPGDQKSAARRQIQDIDQQLGAITGNDREAAAKRAELNRQKTELNAFMSDKAAAPAWFKPETAPAPAQPTVKKPEFAAYDEKNPTLSGVMGAIYNTPNVNPQVKSLVERMNSESDPEKRQVLIDQIAKLPGGAVWAQTLNTQNDRTRSQVQAKATGDNIPGRDTAGSVALGGGLPRTGTLANQAVSPTEVPTTYSPPPGSPPKNGADMAPKTSAGAREDAQKKLDTMTAELKKTKDPKAWWEVLAAIADVAASGAFGYAGQRHETQAQRDLQAEREAQQAEEEYARQMAFYNAQQGVESAQRMEEIEAQQRFQGGQSAADRALQRELAQLRNVPPIAPAF